MKRLSLLWKLILAFLLVAVTATGIVAVFIRMTSAERLSDFILNQQGGILKGVLEDYYAEHGSWEGIEEKWFDLQIRTRVVVARPNGTPELVVKDRELDPGFRSGERNRFSFFGLADEQGRVIVSNSPANNVGSAAPANELVKGVALTVDDRQVGTILTAPDPPRLNPEEALFLRRTNDALLYAGAGAMLVALLVGVLLARTLIQPLHSLTQAAQKITEGQLEQQVEVRTQDEIGQLADAFNRMSREIARINSLRKQMTADVAHDLRTPLTVIAGYVESMRDGVLKPTPERFDLIYTEIERLQDLVVDLKMLSQVDAGELPLHPQLLSVQELLEQAAAPFQHHAAQQGVTLRIETAPNLPNLRVDEARMMQVFGNLLSNSLRYTPAGGEIVLSAGVEEAKVILSVRDNGTGIPEEELPLIFDRFHRVDRSRHADSGESGLGLAIVRGLVEAQGGEVHAQSQLGAGTTITICFPAA